MLKFARFDPTLNITRLPLSYSLGDLSAIREVFTQDPGDIGRIQLPILPSQVEIISDEKEEFAGYLVEISSALLVAIREFLKSIIPLIHGKDATGSDLDRHDMIIRHHYTEARRECMNRIGIRLIEVIKQDRRLGLYNLFWLMLSKHVINLIEQVIPEQMTNYAQYRIVIHSILAQTLQQVLTKVQTNLQKQDKKKRRYSPYIHDILVSHLGAAFNYEFSRSIITDQIHFLFPHLCHNNFLECARLVFTGLNDHYDITHADFVKICSGVRSYIEGRLQKGEPGFYEMLGNIFKIPTKTINNLPVEMILFHPTIISLFAEEIKQLPARSRKRRFFRSWSPRLGREFGEEAWEFAINDYLNFTKDLRRSEIIAFLRNRIVFVRNTPGSSSSSGFSRRGSAPGGKTRGIFDKISYQFDKGRIVNNLRSVTLVFLDLRGFTELSAEEHITDQELKEHLYAFFDPVVNILNHFGGTIKNYAGDSILAAFGAESKYKNHALNAVRAALEIQKLFQLLQQEGKVSFKGMGIGIHTGLVEEAHFFFDLESPGYNTVIGLAANLVGRLSSGKAEKKRKLDLQMASSLLENLMISRNVDISLIANVEEVLAQAVDTFHQRQEEDSLDRREPQRDLSVKIIQGVLNNQGIAISGVENGTFERIRASVDLKEVEAHNRIHYTFFDDVLREQIVFIKAGDASFKGIDTGNQGRIPVWGVYLERNL